MINNDKINKILEKHKNDKEQLDFIRFTEQSLTIAPAGYGKTEMLISKLNYIIESKQIKYPKRILVLTLSNVAKHTIESRLNNNQFVDIYNFHNLASRILRLQGKQYLNIDYQYEYKHYNLKDKLQEKYKNDNDKIEKILNCHREKISEINKKFHEIKFDDKIFQYVDTINKNKEICYEYVIYFAIVLLNNFNINEIYKNLYSYIFVDECQDINLLHFILLRSIADNEYNKIFFLGDTFQSIMKFADALGEQIEYLLKQHFNITKIIELQKNYRLEGRENISNFQKNIRNYDKKLEIELDEDFQIKSFNYFEEEISFINNQINKIISENKKARIAILCPTKYSLYDKNNKLIEKMESIFTNLKINNIEYINTLLFSDNLENEIYDKIKDIKRLNYNNIMRSIENYHFYNDDIKKLIEGYRNYCLKFGIDFNTIIEVIKEKDLIKYAPYCSVNVNILNIHKAKGAEWDYVFIPFVNKEKFPFFYKCSECRLNTCDEIIDTKQYKEEFYQAFYVAITRTKYGLYITSTKNNASCLFYHSLKLINNID